MSPDRSGSRHSLTRRSALAAGLIALAGCAGTDDPVSEATTTGSGTTIDRSTTEPSTTPRTTDRPTSAAGGSSTTRDADPSTTATTTESTTRSTADRRTTGADTPPPEVGQTWEGLVDLGTAWSTAAGDSQNTQYVPDAAGVRDPTIRRVRVRGMYKHPKVAVAGGTAYYRSNPASYAMLGDGSFEWVQHVDRRLTHYTPDVTTDLVVTTSRGLGTTEPDLSEGGDAVGLVRGSQSQGTVYARDRSTGTERWRVDAPVTGPPRVVDGLAYVGVHAGGGGLRGYDLETGDRVVETSLDVGTDASVAGAPAVGPDALYVAVTAEDRSELVAVDRTDGGVRWRRAFGADGSLTSAPSLADGTLYVGHTGGRVVAVSTGGERQWSRSFPAAIYTTPAIADGELYVLARDGLDETLTAVDLGSRSSNWSQSFSLASSGVAVASDVVYATGHTTYAFDRATGQKLWSFPCTHAGGVGGVNGSPVPAGEGLLFGSCIKHSDRPLYDNFVYVVS